jgi:hypothetical protein
MRTLTFTFDSTLPSPRVLEAAHDFTDQRGHVFPAVEAEHFEVHSIGADHADVTEGTGTGIGTNWERCHYDWSSPGSVTAAVTDSNVYALGSSWTITAIAAPQGSRVEMTWARQFKHTIRGRLFGAAFRLAGPPIFRKYARQIIANLEALQDEPGAASGATTLHGTT